MPHSKLKDHVFDPKKRKFLSPMNAVLGNLANIQDWFRERMPEYLWIGLILDFFDSRRLAILYLTSALKQITAEYPDLINPRMSTILAMPEKDQKRVFDILEQFVPKDVISPLTILYTFSQNPYFASRFATQEYDVQKSSSILERVMKKATAFTSDFSTDIAFFIVYTFAVNGKIHLPKNKGFENVVDDLNSYAEADVLDDEKRKIQGFIRCHVLTSASTYENNQIFLDDFWKKTSSLFECSSMYFKYEKDVSDNDVDLYASLIKDIYLYYREMYRVIEPLNLKFLVLLGLAVYSYKRFLEIVEHNLYNAISGRSIVRVMIECYLMMKYLLKKSKEKETVWEEYQFHGIGKYKATLKNHQENTTSLDKSHINVDYLNLIVNEFKDEEFVDIDTSYFDDIGIRTLAITVEEKDLYSLYYNYDSSFEHGLWGAIRESSLIACQNPAHQYHSIPDVENLQKMKSVWYDAVMVMNKTIGLLIEEFGISDELKNRMKGNGL